MNVAPSTLSIDELQHKRTLLVNEYADGSPHANELAKNIVTGLGAIAGTAAGIGIVALTNRGKGAMYQSLNTLGGGVASLVIGGGIGGAFARSVFDVTARPTGDAGTLQVAQRQAGLRGEIDVIDRELHARDGRSAQPLPETATSDSAMGIQSGAMALAGGAGLGLLAAAGGMGLNTLGKASPRGGKGALAPVAVGALAAAGISYLNHRDRASNAGGALPLVRDAAIGATALGATAMLPAVSGGSLTGWQRVAVMAGAGAVLGTIMHTVTASDID